MNKITCPQTSEQTSMVERHMVETELTRLAKVSLLLKFWPDAFSTAVYLINRLPTKVLKKNFNGRVSQWKSFLG